MCFASSTFGISTSRIQYTILKPYLIRVHAPVHRSMLLRGRWCGSRSCSVGVCCCSSSNGSGTSTSTGLLSTGRLGGPGGGGDAPFYLWCGACSVCMCVCRLGNLRCCLQTEHRSTRCMRVGHAHSSWRARRQAYSNHTKV